MSITVIIGTLNEEKNLEACLRSCISFDQIYVVDSHSTDQTCQIAESMGATVIQYGYNARTDVYENLVNAGVCIREGAQWSDGVSLYLGTLTLKAGPCPIVDISIHPRPNKLGVVVLLGCQDVKVNAGNEKQYVETLPVRRGGATLYSYHR